MGSRRKHLTSTEVARAIGVSPRLVADWLEAGLLPGHRLPPPTGRSKGDRRFVRADVIAFCKTKGLPCDLPGGVIAVVDGPLFDAIAAIRDVAIYRAACAAEAGWFAAKNAASWAILDRDVLTAWEAITTARCLIRLVPGIRIVVVPCADGEHAAYPDGVTVATTGTVWKSVLAEIETGAV